MSVRSLTFDSRDPATSDDALGPLPEWDLTDLYPAPDAPGKMYTLAGGFLRNIDRFDAEFFGVSPRRAEPRRIRKSSSRVSIY